MRSATGIPFIILILFLITARGYAENTENGQRTLLQKIDYGPDHIWTGPDGKPLPFKTPDDILTFLATAESVQVEIILSGVSRPDKLRLKKDGVEINAVFRHQCRIDNSPSPSAGTAQGDRFFRDCYKSEIAAYEMNRLLGLNNMPPTIFREINGKQGALQLWAEGTMTEKKRMKDKIIPPEVLHWNQQKWDVYVFDNLINNNDRNQGNLLIDSNWRLILIDHTQSFSRDYSLPNPEKVSHCSKGLWYNLNHIDEKEIRSLLSPYLNNKEMSALFKRRAHLIKLIQDLINKNGENKVLF